MIAEISAGLSSLKAAGDILKGVNATISEAKIGSVQVALQSKILEALQSLFEAQQAQSAAIDRIRELEQEIMRLKSWESEKQRYQLEQIGTGAFAYVQKPGVENPEAPHWLCANCYARRQKSFLQFQTQMNPNGSRSDKSTYGCHACKGTIKVSYTRKPE